MEKTELIKKIVAMVMAMLVRDLVTFIFKQSKAATQKLKPSVISILKIHRKLLLPLLDLVTLFMIIFFLFANYLKDTTPATRQFVVYFAFLCLMFVRMFHFLKLDTFAYLDDLKNQRQTKKISNSDTTTRAAP